jgi:hypothetical protein
MNYKVAIKELLNQFNIPPTFDYRRKGIFELVETTRLINSVDVNYLTFAIKAEIVFHDGKDRTLTVLMKKAEFPIRDMNDFLEQLLRFQEDFYRSFYAELVRYTLFAKETTLQHSNGEPYKVIPINKLILGEDVSNIIT